MNGVALCGVESASAAPGANRLAKAEQGSLDLRKHELPGTARINRSVSGNTRR